MHLPVATRRLWFHLWRQFLKHVTPSLLWYRCLGLIFVGAFYESLNMSIWLIVALHGLFLGDAFFKGANWVELANGVHIEGIDAFEGFFADSFLMISKEQTSEFRSLEEILPMVLRFRLRQHVNPLSSVIDLRLSEGRFHGDAVSGQKLISHLLLLLGCLCVQIFGCLASVSLDWSTSLLVGHKRVLLSHKTPLEHILRKVKSRWSTAVGGMVVALSRFVYFHPYLFSRRQPLVMLQSQLIPCHLSFLLNHLLFVVFGPLLLYNCIQKTVAWSFVHLEDPLGDYARDFVFWNMI